MKPYDHIKFDKTSPSTRNSNRKLAATLLTITFSLLSAPVLSEHLSPSGSLDNHITLTFYKPDFYQIIASLIIILFVAFVYIQRTLSSKRKIESLNFNLRRKSSKFKSLFNETSDAMILVKDGVYFDVNLAALNLLEYPDKQTLLNTSVGSLSPLVQPDGTLSSDKIQHHLEVSEREGRTRFEWQCKKLNGRITWLEVTITKVSFNTETVMHMICRDIDDKKKLEAQHAKKNSQLKKTNAELQLTIDNLRATQEKLVATEKMAALGALVAGISHEINTPVGISLTGVSHFKEITEDIIDSFDKKKLSQTSLQAYFSKCEQVCQLTTVNLKKAATLISGFKQIAVDQTSEEQRKFNIKTYIDEILSSIHSVTKKAQIEIAVSCPDNIVVQSYPGAFSQILTNLIINSCIHGFKDESSGKIQIIIHLVEEHLSIQYSDNGVGISEQHLPKIFDPFFTTNRDNGGSGLGLNIIYNLVTNTFNGQIICQSTVSQGTDFNITLAMSSLDVPAMQS